LVCFSLVPIKFPKCSHMNFPGCSQQHLGLIPYGLPKVQLPCTQTGKVKSRGAHFFPILQLGVHSSDIVWSWAGAPTTFPLFFKGAILIGVSLEERGNNLGTHFISILSQTTKVRSGCFHVVQKQTYTRNSEWTFDVHRMLERNNHPTDICRYILNSWIVWLCEVDIGQHA
jgi:hypothetical protein